MQQSEQTHGTAVAFDGRGCLITGAPGRGKSTLALEMIALGADLVADDRVDLVRIGTEILMSAPPSIAGLIEARGAGLIRMPHRDRIRLTLIADLDNPASERLPAGATRVLLGLPLPTIALHGRVGIAAVLAAVLRYGLVDLHEVPAGSRV